MTLLVIGKSGQVARALARRNSDSHPVLCLGRPELDITNAGAVSAAIIRVMPNIVVNAAAYTKVDLAQSESEKAFAVNALGAENVARAAANAGLPIIHISTDYVFSGEADRPYVEDDPTGPLNIYGQSKLAGEIAVAAANEAHAIFRTAWIYDAGGQNFLKTMLNLAARQNLVRVVADQYGNPTFADDIAAGILVAARLIAASPADQALRGIFHAVADGETSWAGFAAEIFDQSRRLGGPHASVEPIATSQYPTPARRPRNSRLNTTRFAKAFNCSMPEWRDALRRCLEQILTPPASDARDMRRTDL